MNPLSPPSNSFMSPSPFVHFLVPPPLAREDRAAGKALEYLAARPGHLLAVMEKMKNSPPADSVGQAKRSVFRQPRDWRESGLDGVVRDALPPDFLARLAQGAQTSEPRVLSALIGQFERIESWIDLDPDVLAVNMKAVERVIQSGRVRMFEYRH